MADEQLRNLRRQAAAGDVTAALKYFYALNRQQPREKVNRDVESPILEIRGRRLAGWVQVHAINLFEVLLLTPTEHRVGGWVGSPTVINQVLYEIRARYFFYPELGWVPFPPETISHARRHWNVYQERIATSGEAPGRDWTYYLPRIYNDVSSRCFICDQVGELYSTFHARRANQPLDPVAIKPAPAAVLDQVLRDACNQFATDHRKLLEEAHLIFINNEMLKLNSKIEEQRNTLNNLERQLADFVIEEVRLQADD